MVLQAGIEKRNIRKIPEKYGLELKKEIVLLKFMKNMDKQLGGSKGTGYKAR